MRHIPSERADTAAHGTTALRAFLLAPLLPPALPTLFGRALPAPFGLSRLVVTTAAALLLADLIARAARRAMTGRSVALRVVLTTLVLSALAVTANAVVRHRANAFYTAQTLADVMAALVAVHLFGAATGRVAARRARVGGGSSPVELVGWLDWVVVALIAAFWVLAAVAYRELAGVLLIFAGAISLLAIPVRLTDGWRGASLGGRMRMKSGERRQSRRRVS